MPATINGGGDQLARGAVRVNFRSSESGTSQQKWDDIFGKDSGPKKNYSQSSDSSSSSASTGTTGVKPAKTRRRKS